MATALVVVVIVMVMVVMVVTAALVVVMIMIMIMMMVMVVMVLFLVFHETQVDFNSLHGLQELLASQLGRRGGYDGGMRIQSPQKLQSLSNLLIAGLLRVGSAENDGAGGFYLILEEFAEILQIHLAFQDVHHGGGTIHHHLGLLRHSFYGMDHIRELAYTGGLNDDSLRMVLIDYLLQGSSEISHQGTADTAGIHLSDLNTRILQKSPIDTDLSEFVFNQNHLLALQSLRQEFPDQSCFPGSQEAGYNIYLRHMYTSAAYSISRRRPASRAGRLLITLLLSSTVNHEVQQLVYVFLLRSNDLQLRNLPIGEDIGQRYILAQLGLKIQSVSLAGYQLYTTLAAVYYFKKFVNVFDILNLHGKYPPVSSRVNDSSVTF